MIRKLAVSLLITSWLLASCGRIGNEMPVLLYLAMAIDKDASTLQPLLDRWPSQLLYQDRNGQENGLIYRIQP